MLVYLLWCTLLLLRQMTQLNARTRNWLIFVIFSLFIITSAYLVVALNLFSTSFAHVSINENPIYFSSGIVYIILPIALIFIYPEVIYGLKNVLPKELSKDDFESYQKLAKRINQYLLTEKPFLNPEFDIANLAKELGVTQKEISLTCKYILEKKFTELRAHLRINYAKELLNKGLSESITIDAIGTFSGFKSRSSYFEAFKAETGMTPSQYLEKLS